MQHETTLDLCTKCLEHIVSDGTGFFIENPAVRFADDARAGKFDDLPDEAYNDMQNEVDELSVFWGNQPRRTAGDILLNMLDRLPVQPDRANDIAGLLAGLLAGPGPDGGAVQETLRSIINKSFEPRTPKEIRDDITRSVIGQPEAVRAAALIMYHQLSGHRTNAVFAGPSGCGKSEIWRCLSKEYPGLVRVVDFSRFSADGWSGSLHLRDIFTGTDPAAIRRRGLVIVLDEADKILCERAVGAGGTDHNAMVQNSLLKMLDGDVIEFGAKDNQPALAIDCSRVSVVMLGAFERLLDRKVRDAKHIGFGSATADAEAAGRHENISHDDLIHAGMRREIAGRVSKIVTLEPLSIDDYKAILTGPTLAGLQESTGCRISITDAAAGALAERAAASGLGVRWMRSEVLNAMDDAVFDAPEAETYAITHRDGKLRCRARKRRKTTHARTDCGCMEDFPF